MEDKIRRLLNNFKPDPSVITNDDKKKIFKYLGITDDTTDEQLDEIKNAVIEYSNKNIKRKTNKKWIGVSTIVIIIDYLKLTRNK